jgi:4-amino-4-deoxy-L-arabinose transferase-like glycosyltransferase
MQEKKWNWKNIGSKPIHLIFIIATIQLAVAFLTDPMILTFDEAMWQYIGHNWIKNGMIPYHGGVDNKSPLIFLIFGVSDWLFGVNYWFPRLLGTAIQSTGIYFLYKIAEKTIGKQAGIMAISFYGLSLIWHSAGGKYVSYTETYAVTLIIVAVFFTLASEKNKYSFIGGIFAGLGLGFRLTSIFGITPLLLFAFRKNRESGFLFLFGSVCCVVILLCAAGLAGIHMGDLFFYGVLDNFGPGSATDHNPTWRMQRFADGFFLF